MPGASWLTRRSRATRRRAGLTLLTRLIAHPTAQRAAAAASRAHDDLEVLRRRRTQGIDDLQRHRVPANLPRTRQLTVSLSGSSRRNVSSSPHGNAGTNNGSNRASCSGAGSPPKGAGSSSRAGKGHGTAAKKTEDVRSTRKQVHDTIPVPRKDGVLSNLLPPTGHQDADLRCGAVPGLLGSPLRA